MLSSLHQLSEYRIAYRKFFPRYHKTSVYSGGDYEPCTESNALQKSNIIKVNVMVVHASGLRYIGFP